MEFIIFDLEWNSVKKPDDRKFINEIIEIGAVLLNEQLQETDSFSTLIRPSISEKLNSYVKSLTHIQEEQLKNQPDFLTVIQTFKRWANRKNCVFLSWSNTDLHVLAENYDCFLHQHKVDFIRQYADLQKYVSLFLKTENNNQVALGAAAEQLGIDTREFALHRALDDSRLCAALLRQTYQKKRFKPYISNVLAGTFYERLLFKPYYITDPDSPLLDKKIFMPRCPQCGKKLQRTGKIRQNNALLQANYRCEKCDAAYRLRVKCKKTYDTIDIKRNLALRRPKAVVSEQPGDAVGS